MLQILEIFSFLHTSNVLHQKNKPTKAQKKKLKCHYIKQKNKTHRNVIKHIHLIGRFSFDFCTSLIPFERHKKITTKN
jgi:hypothetical protein